MDPSYFGVGNILGVVNVGVMEVEGVLEDVASTRSLAVPCVMHIVTE